MIDIVGKSDFSEFLVFFEFLNQNQNRAFFLGFTGIFPNFAYPDFEKFSEFCLKRTGFLGSRLFRLWGPFKEVFFEVLKTFKLS